MVRKTYALLILLATVPFMAAAAMAAGPAAAPSPAAAIPAAPPTYQQPGAAAIARSLPVAPQTAPAMSIGPGAANQFERGDSTLSLPMVLRHQWSLINEVAPEEIISQRYLRTQDNTMRALTLKQAIYIALRNNPGLKAVSLNPVAATESVKIANAAFDPDLTSQGDIIKSVTPSTSFLSTGGGKAFAQKSYDWNFAVSKVSAITNGTFSITFDNDRAFSNSFFASINPNYTPTLAVSLEQPLLRNFGWRFATINVRLAESAQKQQQLSYATQLLSFVQNIGNQYWAVVNAEETLEVQREALKFNNDLVRQNAISVRVGTLAPLDLQEAQSAEATAAANVFTAEANLHNARVSLREAVMLNPAHAFIPQDIYPSDAPNPSAPVDESLERHLELAVEYSPALAGMRESIRQMLLQVKFDQNQLLPQANIGAQFGVNSAAGTTPCNTVFGGVKGNCTPKGGTPDSGAKLPFGGIYGDALNRLWSFGYYNYAAVLNVEIPLDNAAAKAALAQSRIEYEQARMQYRSQLSQMVVQVESGLNSVIADLERVKATQAATYYARQALHDENVRFRVGMATTHDLLQFQEELVAAEGNEVQAEIDLENGKLALRAADGTLLRDFNIEFQVQSPHESPWYARF